MSCFVRNPSNTGAGKTDQIRNTKPKSFDLSHSGLNLIELCNAWENQLFAFEKTKMQISCIVIEQLISTFVFPTQWNPSSF